MDAVFFVFVKHTGKRHTESFLRRWLPKREGTRRRWGGPQEGLGMTLDVYCDCGIDVQCVYYFSIFVSQFSKAFWYGYYKTA